MSRHNAVAVRWLIAHGVDVNAKRSLWDCNHTALHMTAESGAIDMARVLLKYGRDERLKRLAQSIVVEQGQEITYMRSLLDPPAARVAAEHIGHQ